MQTIPSGTITFLFTDIEGSTRLAQEFPDTLQIALNRHHRILQSAVESNNGFVFEIVGDAFCCAFEKADDAVRAAVKAQLALASEKWIDAEIKIRIGIHSGAAEWNGTKYLGYITLARAARVMSAAYGEQILISNDAYKLLDLQSGPGESKSNRTDSGNLTILSLKGKPEISFRDLGERRLKDLIQRIRLFQVMATGLRQDFPPLRTLDTRGNNLPVQITSFVGREGEIKFAKELLKQSSLLTLTGSGGSGKTRLALKIGTDVIDEFDCGVWVVEFESLSANSHIANSITKVLGIIENPKTTVEEQLTGYIKDREMLLIFDNCEHVVSAASILAHNLLTRCPRLKIIATSREALRCEGERIFQISSLSYPEQNEKISPEKLNQFESTRLFIERASSANPSFSLIEDDAPAIAGICNQLEGIPLAIELAAARVKTLSVQQIHKRLDDRFSLLTSGYRTALPRQQTLRALINWSYELLSEKEKVLWNRLSVFSGGWTLEAAEEICTNERIVKAEIIKLLEALAEKSIIIFNSEKVRYKMLESIKQFGEQNLKDEDRLESLSDRHYKYYTDLAAASDKKLKGEEIVKELSVLDIENANISKALESSLKRNRLCDAAKLALLMRTYWEIRGLTTEGLERYESIIRMTYVERDTLYYEILNAAGIFYRLKSNYKRAKELTEQSLKYYRENKDKAGVAESLKNLGLTAYDQGEYLKASEYYNESLIFFNVNGDKKAIADLHFNLGNLSFYQGDYSTALKFYQRSLDLRSEIGDLRGITICFNSLGLIALVQGNYSSASGYFEESLSLNREIGFKHMTAVSLVNLGNLAFEQGEYLKASEYFDESLAIRRETGDKRGIALLLNNLGSISFELGDDDKALEFYQDGLAISRDIGDKSMLVLSLNNLGSVNHELGDPANATRFLEEALAIAREIGEKPAISNSLQELGAVSLTCGDYMKALEYVKGSIDIRSEIGDKHSMAYSLNILALVHFAMGEHSKASEFYEHSLKISRDLGDKPGIASSLTGLSAVLIEEGELQQALNLLNESVDITQKSVGNKKKTALSLYYLGWVHLRNEKFEDARKYFTESLILRKELGNWFENATGILALAVLRKISKDYGQALILLSFVKNYFESNKLALYKSEQTILDKSISELKEKMSAEDLANYLEMGKTITREDAMEMAIDDLGVGISDLEF